MPADNLSAPLGSTKPASEASGPARSGRSGPVEGQRVRLPDFLVIGAPRSGTTTLHYSLGQHPEVFVSGNKETNFFLFENGGEPPGAMSAEEYRRQRARSITTLDDYAALFAGAGDEHRAVGEASPAYLMFPEVAERIARRLPEARLVAILRQPVDQALSLYTARSGGDLPAHGLAEAFVETLTSGATGWPDGGRDGRPIAEYGLYHQHLLPFFERFPPDRIKVTLFEDLQRDSGAFFADLFRFLDVDHDFRPDLSQRYNESGAPRSALLHRVLSGSPELKALLRRLLPHRAAYHLARLQHRLRGANLNRTQGLPPALRRDLTERFYADDIMALERLLGRDLGLWRE